MSCSVSDLAVHAREIRAKLVENSSKTSTPHLGSCLSCTDILTVLYFHTLRIDPTNPTDPQRDRFFLSKGHAAPALFFTLARRGFYPDSLMADYGDDGSLFGEHPPIPGKIPGIDAASGSLGHGLPLAVGLAMAGRIRGRNNRVVALLGDGECNEGTIWEAAMLAGIQKLDRLVAIVDFNNWQGTGRSTEIMALTPLVEKWQAFGWDAVEIDGHDLAALQAALSEPSSSGRPKAIIAKTVKGKGVSFMEDDNNWHYRIPTADEVVAAKQELGVHP